MTRPDPSPPEALRATALQWLAQGLPAAVVTVTATQGSVPREAGTRMLVGLGTGPGTIVGTVVGTVVGTIVGTIGGGQLEHQAIAEARALLQRAARGEPAPPLHQRIALGPSLGQCCGGVVQLRIAALVDDPPAAWPAPASLFTLQLYGAGHVGRAIVKLLADLPCEVAWIDERESEFPPVPLPLHIRRVCVEPEDPMEAEVAAAPPGAFFLVLTHSHALDLAITRAILARGDFGFFGLIGSATKRAKFEARLRERGIDEAALARITCPIGIGGLSGKAPEIIAIGAVAQLLQQAGA